MIQPGGPAICPTPEHGLLRGNNADAAVLSEPTFLRIGGAQRGGRTAPIEFYRQTAPGETRVAVERPFLEWLEGIGLEGPCDMFVFHPCGIPAVCWGARGGNTFAADEYLKVDSVISAARSLLVFACRRCGVP